MLESYEQEVIRKRRASRIFWFLVFSFATFLYFFFQGYYPALDITWRQVFSSGGMRELSKDELIRSFGIINVRTYPRESNMVVNGEAFGFDEKRMVPYGKYRLSVGKPGYIQDRVRFEITKKTPYFISEIHLMPRAKYTKVTSGEIQISPKDEGTWIAVEAKKHLIYDKFFSTGTRIPPLGKLIGEGFFLSGSSLYKYENSDWEKKSWSGSINLIKKCGDSLRVEFSYLICDENQEVLSSDGHLYGKVISVTKKYLLSENTLYANGKEFALNSKERQNTLFIEVDNTWYTPSEGLLIPLFSNKSRKTVPLIDTSLDSIRNITTLDGNIIALGKKGDDTFMVLFKDDGKMVIPFPDIPLDGLDIYKSKGVIFIKTNNVILFIYEGSERIEWLTEGEILAYSDVSGIYRKDGEIWKVDWSDSAQ
ncbi:MAG: hypothetical protein HHAS10_01800 [Candidatus Altimarinota bacterium]